MKKVVIVFTALSILAGCGPKKDKKAELEALKIQETEIKGKIAALEAELAGNPDSLKSKGISVGVSMLKGTTFKNYIDVQGRVDADQNVSLSTEMPGTITRINVKAGDEVSVGQVLAETDARAISQSMADLEISMALVNQIYEKQKNLWDQKIGSEVQFLQAKANKESMDKKMSTLQQQMNMSKIVSPINGTVDAVDIKLGQAVAPGIPAIRVINFSNLKVKADIAESYASKVKKGSEVIIRFPDMNDSVVSTVNFVARSISSASRTFSVEVLLDDKKEYHPNMVARLSINDYQSSPTAITVPVRTIQRDEANLPFVFVAENGIAKKRLVTTGKEYRGQAEILSGLKEGDMLVTLGYNLINDGDRIETKK